MTESDSEKPEAAGRERFDSVWVCPWDICNHEQAQHCRFHDGNTKNTRGCGHQFPPGTTPDEARRLIRLP